MSETKITSDTILLFLKEAVESKKMLNPSLWLESAFKLNILLGDEHGELEKLRQDVAVEKLRIMKGQEKKNVAACEIEIQASDIYKFYRLQEFKVSRIEELIKIAKKNASQY